MLDRYLEATRSPFRGAARRLRRHGAQRPLYLPAHTAAAIDAPTLQKLRTAGRDLKRGICERKHVTTLMECAFENPIVASAKLGTAAKI